MKSYNKVLFNQIKEIEDQFDEDSDEEQFENINTDKVCKLCEFKCIIHIKLKKHVNC